MDFDCAIGIMQMSREKGGIEERIEKDTQRLAAKGGRDESDQGRKSMGQRKREGGAAISRREGKGRMPLGQSQHSFTLTEKEERMKIRLTGEGRKKSM